MNKVPAILIAQSGGPTTVINASAYGIISACMASPAKYRILFAKHGIDGLLGNNIYDITNEDPQQLALLAQTPACIFGSCRTKIKTREQLDTITSTLAHHNVHHFFYIGGNDSMDTCAQISAHLEDIHPKKMRHKNMRRENMHPKNIRHKNMRPKNIRHENMRHENMRHKTRVIGIPKTIDNDLAFTDHCPGFGSSAKYIATTCKELSREACAYSGGQVIILEVMGRDTGWLAASSALANKEATNQNNKNAPYASCVDLIYMPEIPFDAQKFIKDTKTVLAKKGSALIVVAEGIKDINGNYIMETGARSSYLNNQTKSRRATTNPSTNSNISTSSNTSSNLGTHSNINSSNTNLNINLNSQSNINSRVNSNPNSNNSRVNSNPNSDINSRVNSNPNSNSNTRAKTNSNINSQSKNVKDSFGHARLGGVANILGNLLSPHITARVRTIELGILQRCASHCASATDMQEALQLGKHAFQMAESGHTAKMVSLKRHKIKKGARAICKNNLQSANPTPNTNSYSSTNSSINTNRDSSINTNINLSPNTSPYLNANTNSYSSTNSSINTNRDSSINTNMNLSPNTSPYLNANTNPYSNTNTYACSLTQVDLARVANRVKYLPRKFISTNGNFVSKAFIDYARPLILGEINLIYNDGLPIFAHLNPPYA